MARTRVKICGIMRPADAADAAEVGADAIGLNFLRGPRKITLDRLSVILDAMPPMVMPVVLLGDGYEFYSLDDFLDRSQRRVPVWTFQLYDDKPDLVEMDKRAETFSWWWVAHVTDRDSISKLGQRFDNFDLCHPAAIVLDTASPDKLGGTGRTFNWNWIAEARAAGELEGLPPIILAGGLTPENVAEAIRIARPYAVDVSSGVEVAGKPGIKDAVKMRDFIQAVRGVE